MKIDQYLYIIEIADTGSFTQAARNLFISQPNLSYTVKQLEQKLGYPIFTRTGSGVFPTKQGAELIDRLRFLKREYDMIEDMIENKDLGSRLSLKVATLNMISTSSAFATIAERYCSSRIDFSLNNYSTLSEVLKHLSEVDLAIVGMITPYVKNLQSMFYSKGIEYHPISNLPLCAFVGEKHPLYRKTNVISVGELSQYTLLQLTDSSEDPQQSISHALGLANRSFGNVSVNTWQAFFQVLENTQIVGLDSFSPDAFLKHKINEHIHLLQIKDCDIHWQAAWIKKRKQPLSDLAAEFLELTKSFF